jgi:hypothetical protein
LLLVFFVALPLSPDPGCCSVGFHSKYINGFTGQFWCGGDLNNYSPPDCVGNFQWLLRVFDEGVMQVLDINSASYTKTLCDLSWFWIANNVSREHKFNMAGIGWANSQRAKGEEGFPCRSRFDKYCREDRHIPIWSGECPIIYCDEGFSTKSANHLGTRHIIIDGPLGNLSQTDSRNPDKSNFSEDCFPNDVDLAGWERVSGDFGVCPDVEPVIIPMDNDSATIGEDGLRITSSRQEEKKGEVQLVRVRVLFSQQTPLYFGRSHIFSPESRDIDISFDDGSNWYHLLGDSCLENANRIDVKKLPTRYKKPE